ncbi:helix-turn-helix transcriptional regulator [Actinomadura craniellae]|uniref:Helix-turn-helix transcriptional regulator n=2 Tax=Actinomadura craniellae TaxID=2231787 RepID=A0A365GWN5_9ACTN|nr:helix-turn-helix transcriptional regulator [Actinomadura craniellae]
MLRGRDHEVETLGALLDRARGGRGGALAVVGGPGMGKSALLEHAVRTASGFEVLGTRGNPPERSMPFAGLHRLLQPVARRIGDLTSQQAVTLAPVVGTGDPRDTDAFAVNVAVHRMLTVIAADRPVLCWMDDVQYLDPATLEALTFAARRLGGEPVVMLFAARDDRVGHLGGDPLAEIPRLRPAGLDDEVARRLLEDHLDGGVAEETAGELTDLAGGNPLALIDLARALTPRQLSGEDPPPAALPPRSRLRALYARRYRRLPADARWLTLLAAADERLTVETLTLAAAETGADLDALEAARTAGLIVLDGDAVTVPHRLIRSSLYAEAPLAERRAAHELLALVLDGERHRLRRALHRSATAEEDEGLAGELDRAASRARRTGDYADASRAGRRAAALTPAPERRAERLVAAATDAWLAGRPRRSRTLLRQVRPLATGPALRGLADLLHGTIELRDGTPAAGRQALLSAAGHLLESDRTLALTALTRAGEAACSAGDHVGYCEIADRVLALRGPAEPPAVELMFEHFAGLSAGFRGRHDEAAGPLRRVIELAGELDDCPSLVWGCVAALGLGDNPRARDLATRAVTAARELGSPALLPNALDFLSLVQFGQGHYPAAVATSLDGLRLARAAGQRNSAIDHLARLAVVAAMLGDRETALLRLRAVGDQPTARGLVRADGLSAWALACLDLIEDRHSDAAVRLRPLLGVRQVHPTVGMMAVPHFVEAAVHCGREEPAGRVLRIYERWARSTGCLVRQALAERCRALLAGDDTDAERHFQEALRLHHRTEAAFELAKTELLYGHRLRRGRRPKDARGHLRNALRTFEQHDADHWADRARSELRAAGESVQSEAEPALDTLTPQQLQISRLVSEGATNREIAAQLVLSPRTIDHHLRNIYAKLGIRSRVELSRHFQ